MSLFGDNVFKCECGKENDLTDIIHSEKFMILGCNFSQLINLCRFYRVHNMDWPPKVQ